MCRHVWGAGRWDVTCHMLAGWSVTGNGGHGKADVGHALRPPHDSCVQGGGPHPTTDVPEARPKPGPAPSRAPTLPPAAAAAAAAPPSAWPSIVTTLSNGRTYAVFTNSDTWSHANSQVSGRPRPRQLAWSACGGSGTHHALLRACMGSSPLPATLHLTCGRAVANRPITSSATHARPHALLPVAPAHTTHHRLIPSTPTFHPCSTWHTPS